MLRVFVDSGSSIKQEEKEKYNVEIIPLKILLGDKEYQDGVDLSMEEFYHQLIDNKIFPKTSLPSMVEFEKKINEYTSAGDDVIIITISSKISGTYNFIRLLFEDNNKVTVIDSLTAVGGIRLLVNEINRYRHEITEVIVSKVKSLISRIKVLAIPESLTYLLRGGRLSKVSYAVGTALRINPIISLDEGKVHVDAKKRGIRHSMEYIVNALDELKCDPNYEIIPSYTYKTDNLEKLISMTDPKYHAQMKVYDNLDPAIACHWGPNAFGYIFVKGE
ncbi:MAG: DegV family protein [Bacilli bacterium]|nr:DegV family protein [Bacilli bacterium]